MRGIASFIKAHSTKIIIAAMVVVFLLAAVLIFFKTANHAGANHVSGAWLTMASDLADGYFYRDLFSERGVGGTRFFPVTFALQAIPIKLGASPLVAGQIIAVSTGLLFLGVVLLFLRRLTNDWLIIFIVFGIFTLSSAVSIGLSSTRGDVLPVLFNLMGLYWAIFKRQQTMRWEYVSALFFICAFATKITSVGGAMSIVGWLCLTGEKKSAAKVGVTYAAGIIMVIATLYFITDGRIWEIFRTCSTASPDLMYVLMAPVYFVQDAISDDFVTVCLLIVAAFSMIVKSSIPINLPVNLYFLFSILQTVIIYSSPGIDSNHLIDIATAATLVICGQFQAAAPGPETRRRISIVLVVIALFCSMNVVEETKQEVKNFIAGEDRFSQELITYLSQFDNVLSEDPSVNLVLGEEVFIQDAFMYKFVIEKRPEAETFMLKSMQNKEYGAVVLLQDPESSDTGWYEYFHFNSRFIQTLQTYYRYDRLIGVYYIFLPR